MVLPCYLEPFRICFLFVIADFERYFGVKTYSYQNAICRRRLTIERLVGAGLKPALLPF